VLFSAAAASELENWSLPLVESDETYIPLVRQADVDNQNAEGGFWVVSDGFVFDLFHLKSQFQPELVDRCIRKSILL